MTSELAPRMLWLQLFVLIQDASSNTLGGTVTCPTQGAPLWRAGLGLSGAVRGPKIYLKYYLPLFVCISLSAFVSQGPSLTVLCIWAYEYHSLTTFFPSLSLLQVEKLRVTILEGISKLCRVLGLVSEVLSPYLPICCSPLPSPSGITHRPSIFLPASLTHSSGPEPLRK